MDDLFPAPLLKPLHYLVADRLAHEAKQEAKFAAERAMEEVEFALHQIRVRYHRSIAQRRRFWRLRILQEKA